MVAATSVMGVALIGTRMALVPVGGRHVGVVVLGVLIIVGLVGYGASAQLLGVLDITRFLRGSYRRVVRRAA
jgi:hypothetical protein